MLDGYANVFEVPGTRTTGTDRPMPSPVREQADNPPAAAGKPIVDKMTKLGSYVAATLRSVLPSKRFRDHGSAGYLPMKTRWLPDQVWQPSRLCLAMDQRCTAR
ncbi:uncharacterized protein RMCFA_0278 [Mycolicibacterium fortuitum subsp. acetamidolyticum]|uniref:Uncharacterized protein n=1 Tax=Mycolicibacterium fortuitum subsp. acetamidolyticum TaxID=144550 RepID=A0A100WLP9_MYCFO|nr:uncharacterized protein RMCFA_0278 [Mycolicibacterium fortuitum subsp. acetamidolyticum]